MRPANVARAVLACALLVFGAAPALAADTDIVITEIMQNPLVLADTDGEWFELHNTGPDPVDIEGWTIKDDGTNSIVVASGGPLVVPAGAYVVLARNAAAMATQGVTVFYQYGGTGTFDLGNSDDEIVLLNTSLVEIDRVMWDGGPVWPDPNGASMMWDESSGDNNVGANWATSTAVFGDGDFGTPGAPNGGVPLQAPMVSNVIHRPILPEPGETVTVTAEATDADGTVTAVTLWVQLNGGGFASTAMGSTGGSGYSATIAAGLLGDAVDYYVQATDNDAQTGVNPAGAPANFYSYTVAPRTITPIATIHADSAGYDGTLVTVRGQVFIPGDYRADGTTVSAWLQDGSGRGLNVFGTTFSTGGALLNDTSAIVEVTGRMDWFGTTVEIVNYEVTTLSTGNPVLTPTLLGTGAAAAPANEGTYIRSAGPITAIATTGGTNPAHNVTIDDGTGPVVVRIDDDVVLDLASWLVGDQVTAAGAGGTFAGQGQIIVGLGSDVVNDGQGPDTTPPLLLSANLTTPTTVTLQFDEAIEAITGGTAGNYSVYETAAPGNTIAVLTAAVQVDPTKVVLTLAADPTGTPHTLAVVNVTDLAGNPVAPGTTAAIIEPAAAPQIVITEVMQNPLVLLDAVGEWFEIHNAGAVAVDINGWTIRDLGTDSHVINNGGPLVINPGEYKVLGINAAAMAAEGVTLFYQYTGITLGNADDELILETAGAVLVDQIAWDGGPVWPDPNGASMQWSGNGDNADGATWSNAITPFGSGDLGTPGTANDDVSAVPVPGLFSELRGNVPNPFNPSTAVFFSLDRDGHARLDIYDVRGRQVRTLVDAQLTAGSYDGAYRWDGRDDQGRSVTSGTYFQRLELDGKVVGSRKMMLVR
ncbi:MAG: lamin tail domain-containing protein [Krumholzibacteria bacterium]|nr:lamin tail domain-containing protein [Candidatus Krumholzibacteria bacterium]